jgi:hypothetical protein
MISIDHVIPTDPAGQAESYRTGPVGVEYTNMIVKRQSNRLRTGYCRFPSNPLSENSLIH